MDRLIRRFDYKKDGDLNLCIHRGIGYQRDTKRSVPYDKSYWEKYIGYEKTEISQFINQGRRNFVNMHTKDQCLDIGIGSGEFIKNRKNTMGFDINQHAVRWLNQKGLYSDKIEEFNAITFWDVLEHVSNPEIYLKKIKRGALVFVSIPIHEDLHRIRESKHYRPDEHYYHFTHNGFIEYMRLYGFRLVDTSEFEMTAARDSAPSRQNYPARDNIYSFVFCKDLPDYHDLLGQYCQVHSNTHYGSSAYLYFAEIAKVVFELQPKSIIDYGCGRSDIATYFWKDGEREIVKYDPAIPQYKEMPKYKYDLAFCFDLLEHINMRDVDRVLEEVTKKGHNALFSISTVPAKAQLPNKMNAHVTLLTKSEWLRWIQDYYVAVRMEKSPYDNILILRATNG